MNWNKFFKIIGIAILTLLAVMLVLAIIGFISYRHVLSRSRRWHSSVQKRKPRVTRVVFF